MCEGAVAGVVGDSRFGGGSEKGEAVPRQLWGASLFELS